MYRVKRGNIFRYITITICEVPTVMRLVLADHNERFHERLLRKKRPGTS